MFYGLHGKDDLMKTPTEWETGLVPTQASFAGTALSAENNAHRQLDFMFTYMIFTLGLINFAVNHHNHRFASVLRNLTLCPIDPRSFVNSAVITPLPSPKKDEDLTFDPAGLSFREIHI